LQYGTPTLAGGPAQSGTGRTPPKGGQPEGLPRRSARAVAPAAHAARRIEGQAARLPAAGAYIAWREKDLRDNSLVMRDPPGQRILRATRGPRP
jgi:hypothetical protein